MQPKAIIQLRENTAFKQTLLITVERGVDLNHHDVRGPSAPVERPAMHITGCVSIPWAASLKAHTSLWLRLGGPIPSAASEAVEGRSTPGADLEDTADPSFAAQHIPSCSTRIQFIQEGGG